MASTDENKKSKEIDILGMLYKVLKEWKLVALFILAFAIVGVVVAFSTKKRYTTTVVLAPEASSAGVDDGLSAAAGIIGLNMGGNSGGDAIFPELYPNIFTSSTFLINLFDVKVPVFQSGDTITYYKHLKLNYKPPFWKYPKIWLAMLIRKLSPEKRKNPNAAGGVDPFWLTEEQDNICNMMRANINCVVDQKNGLVTINVTDFDELIAATIADSVTFKLQDYIIEYRTKKARHDLAFLEKMYAQVKDEYIQAQEAYAKVADASQSLVMSRSRVKVEHLRNEMGIKYAVYSEVTTQLQMARQRVQERTPAFMVIQPATVSLEASSMGRMMVTAIFGFLGFVVGSLWCLYGREYYYTYRNRKKQNK